MHKVTDGGEGPQTSQFQRLPTEMRALPQWCVTVGTATDKAPRTVSGGYAKVDDPTTWTDFDTACRVASERGWRIGFVFTANDPFACIDLDVVNEQTQAAKGQPIDPSKWTTPSEIDRFVKIANAFDSYAEVSRSGFGLHVLLNGNIGEGRRRDGVEVYSQERFLICTGDVWGGDRPLADRNDLLKTLVGEMKPPTPEVALWGDPSPNWPLADRASQDEGELGRLFRGDWQGRYESQSEADLALVKLLLPDCESPSECWATFRLSKLGERDKAKRQDYARRTISLASQHHANDAAQVQHGQTLAEALFWKPTATHNSRHFKLLRDGELDQLPALQWLVKRIIPDKGIGAIYGDSGTFKSFLALDLLAHISTGQDWFEKRVRAAPAVYVPFEGQGGIPNRVKAWRLGQAKLRNPDALMIASRRPQGAGMLPFGSLGMQTDKPVASLPPQAQLQPRPAIVTALAVLALWGRYGWLAAKVAAGADPRCSGRLCAAAWLSLVVHPSNEVGPANRHAVCASLTTLAPNEAGLGDNAVPKMFRAIWRINVKLNALVFDLHVNRETLDAHLHAGSPSCISSTRRHLGCVLVKRGFRRCDTNPACRSMGTGARQRGI